MRQSKQRSPWSWALSLPALCLWTVLTALVALLFFREHITPFRAKGDLYILTASALLCTYLLPPVQNQLRRWNEARKDAEQERFWAKRAEAEKRREVAVEARRQSLEERQRKRREHQRHG